MIKEEEMNQTLPEHPVAVDPKYIQTCYELAMKSPAAD
jgi:hypothetical protein